jgi:integrase
MMIPSYLATSRHGLYYFRFPIPSRLHPECKQSCIRFSLDTRCPREALHIARALGYAGDQMLRHTGMQSMDYKTIREVLHEHFKAMLERHKQRLATHGRLSSLDVTALHNSHALTLDALKTQDYTFFGTDSHMAHVIDAYDLPIKRNSSDYSTLRTEFLRAYRDYCKAAIAQDAELDEYDFKPAPQGASVASKPKRKKLADAIDTYCKEKLRIQDWRENTEREYRSQFALLLEYLGEDASLHVSPELASDVKNMLLRLPKRRSQGKLGKLALREQLEVPDMPLICAVTVSKHMITYSAFYDWAVKRKETDENNFRALIDNVKNAHIERDVFNKEQITSIFAAAMKAKIPHHKWGLLIGFYTGARVNEIAQLYADDIIQHEGIWCFRITDARDDQSLKNKSSRRVIPIHSRLIELGFFDLVKKAGTGRIFYKISYQKKYGYGRGISRWVNESLLPRLGIKSETLMFHCIRHTVAQQLRDNKVEQATLMDILGHGHAGVTMSTYANNLDKRVMQEAIETLAYA